MMGSNPCKTFIYRDFYKKWKDNKLEYYKAYIPASVYDNPFISEHYIENLKKLDNRNRERLLNGNWEYDDDPMKLFDYDKIIDMFTNEAKRGRKYCIVDQAGFGRDKCVISFWEGLFVTEAIMKENVGTEELDKMLKERQIPRSQCLVDEVGVGFGLVKDLQGVVGFVAGSSPLKKKKENEEERVTHNYRNLRSQCWFMLANYVNSGLIGIYKNVPMDIKNMLIEDLEQMKQVNADKDTTLQVISKDELKKMGSLTRSTDAGDSWMMRMYFEINPNELTWDFFNPGKENPEETDKDKRKLIFGTKEYEEERQRLLKEVHFGPVVK
jgi:hypothetical protein